MKALFSIATRRPADLAPLAQRLARALAPGDCVTLTGPLGAGKTELARAVIRAMAGDEELEVPSPTFTLVQYYDTPVPVAHADLYRVEHEAEWVELGLDDVMETSAMLIEWPDRAGAYLPVDHLALLAEVAPDGGRVWSAYGAPSWQARLLGEPAA